MHSPFKAHKKVESQHKVKNLETLQDDDSPQKEELGTGRKKKFPGKYNESLLQHTLSPQKNSESRTSVYRRKQKEQEAHDKMLEVIRRKEVERLKKVSKGEITDPLLKHLAPEELQRVAEEGGKHWLNPAGGYNRDAGKAKIADEHRRDQEDYFFNLEPKRRNNKKGNENIRHKSQLLMTQHVVDSQKHVLQNQEADVSPFVQDDEKRLRQKLIQKYEARKQRKRLEDTSPLMQKNSKGAL